MDPITWGILGGAGVGLLKNMYGRGEAAKERKLQSEIARYSPWTGMQAHGVQNPNLLADVAPGALTGAMVGSMYKPEDAVAAVPGAAPVAPGYPTNQSLASPYARAFQTRQMGFGPWMNLQGYGS